MKKQTAVAALKSNPTAKLAHVRGYVDEAWVRSQESNSLATLALRLENASPEHLAALSIDLDYTFLLRVVSLRLGNEAQDQIAAAQSAA
jgi:hypothetical protein